MGLFDLLKKKAKADQNTGNTDENVSIDPNVYITESLKQRLIEMGYKVERHTQYLSLIVNDELEIALVVINNPENHQNLLQVRVLTMHPILFQQGIDENVIGLGLTLKEKTDIFIRNYIDIIFLTLIDGLSDTHDPNLDMNIETDGKNILWHPKLSALNFQGQWNEYPQEEHLIYLLKDIIPGRIISNKINWLKIYAIKMPDSSIMADCYFNNEQWDEGQKRVIELVKSWELNGDFRGIKQFIVFRRCDMYD